MSLLRYNSTDSRYELTADADDVAQHGARAGEVLSAVDVTERGTVAAFTHTYTNPAQRGRGLAAQIVEFAVDDVAARGMTVLPTCWYVAQWFDEHPERAALRAG